jgi:hypothetical protein
MEDKMRCRSYSTGYNTLKKVFERILTGYFRQVPWSVLFRPKRSIHPLTRDGGCRV